MSQAISNINTNLTGTILHPTAVNATISGITPGGGGGDNYTTTVGVIESGESIPDINAATINITPGEEYTLTIPTKRKIYTCTIDSSRSVTFVYSNGADAEPITVPSNAKLMTIEILNDSGNTTFMSRDMTMVEQTIKFSFYSNVSSEGVPGTFISSTEEKVLTQFGVGGVSAAVNLVNKIMIDTDFSDPVRFIEKTLDDSSTSYTYSFT